jgi:hypothetical protein
LNVAALDRFECSLLYRNREVGRIGIDERRSRDLNMLRRPSEL